MGAFGAWLGGVFAGAARGGTDAVAAHYDRERDEELERKRLTGAVTYKCPDCGGRAWSREPGATVDDVIKIHRGINRQCPRVGA